MVQSIELQRARLPVVAPLTHGGLPVLKEADNEAQPGSLRVVGPDDSGQCAFRRDAAADPSHGKVPAIEVPAPRSSLTPR